jgi:hypothetical protein
MVGLEARSGGVTGADGDDRCERLRRWVSDAVFCGSSGDCSLVGRLLPAFSSLTGNGPAEVDGEERLGDMSVADVALGGGPLMPVG